MFTSCRFLIIVVKKHVLVVCHETKTLPIALKSLSWHWLHLLPPLKHLSLKLNMVDMLARLGWIHSRYLHMNIEYRASVIQPSIPAINSIFLKDASSSSDRFSSFLPPVCVVYIQPSFFFFFFFFACSIKKSKYDKTFVELCAFTVKS